MTIKEGIDVSHQIIAYKYPFMNISLYDSFITLVEKLYHFYYVYLSTYKHAFKRIKEIAVSGAEENENITETSIFSIEASHDASKSIPRLILSLDNIAILLDKYEVITRPPVSVYARINDISKEERKAENSDKDGPAVIDDFETIKNKCKRTDWNNLAKEAKIRVEKARPDEAQKLMKNANKYKSMANKWSPLTCDEDKSCVMIQVYYLDVPRFKQLILFNGNLNLLMELLLLF